MILGRLWSYSNMALLIQQIAGSFMILKEPQHSSWQTKAMMSGWAIPEVISTVWGIIT